MCDSEDRTEKPGFKDYQHTKLLTIDTRGRGSKGKKTSAALDNCILALDPCLDDIRCAPYPGGDADCLHRTIGRTGAAFHAAVQVFYNSLFINNLKHRMRADHPAHTAADAGLFIQLQGGDVLQISKLFHIYNSAALLILSNERRSCPGNYTDKHSQSLDRNTVAHLFFHPGW